MLLRRFKNMNYYPQPHRVTVVLLVQGVGERTLFLGNSSGWFSNGTFASAYDASKKSWVCGSCLNHSKISDWKLHSLDLDPTLKPGEIITVLHTLLKICWLVLVLTGWLGVKHQLTYFGVQGECIILGKQQMLALLSLREGSFNINNEDLNKWFSLGMVVMLSFLQQLHFPQWQWMRRLGRQKQTSSSKTNFSWVVLPYRPHWPFLRSKSLIWNRAVTAFHCSHLPLKKIAILHLRRAFPVLPFL